MVLTGQPRRAMKKTARAEPGLRGEVLALQTGERLVLQVGRSGQQRPDGKRLRTAAAEQAGRPGAA
jgi:hypothetical protein